MRGIVLLIVMSHDNETSFQFLEKKKNWSRPVFGDRFTNEEKTSHSCLVAYHQPFRKPLSSSTNQLIDRRKKINPNNNNNNEINNCKKIRLIEKAHSLHRAFYS
jgi:hypothetical protein